MFEGKLYHETSHAYPVQYFKIALAVRSLTHFFFLFSSMMMSRALRMSSLISWGKSQTKTRRPISRQSCLCVLEGDRPSRQLLNPILLNKVPWHNHLHPSRILTVDSANIRPRVAIPLITRATQISYPVASFNTEHLHTARSFATYVWYLLAWQPITPCT